MPWPEVKCNLNYKDKCPGIIYKKDFAKYRKVNRRRAPKKRTEVGSTGICWTCANAQRSEVRDVWGHPTLTLWCHLTKCHFQIACVECVVILGLILNDKSFDLMSIKFVRVNNLFNGIWLHWLRFSVELELTCRAVLKYILSYELYRIKSSSCMPVPQVQNFTQRTNPKKFISFYLN